MVTRDEYKAFVGELELARGLEDRAKALRDSKDPNAASNARTDLTSIINGAVGPQTIIETTPDTQILAYVPGLKKVFDVKSLSEFIRNPDGIIETAGNLMNEKAEKDYTEKGKKDETKYDFHKYARRFLDVAPVETGNVRYDAIAQHHALYKGIVDGIKEYQRGGEDPSAALEFIQSTVRYIAEDVKNTLRERISVKDLFDENNPDDKKEIEDVEEAINDLAVLVADSYVSSAPERALLRANVVAGNIGKRIGRMLPKDERADYAEAMVKAQLAEAKKIFSSDRGKGREAYRVVLDSLYQLIR
ncbi:hypothetical protein HYV50_03710 [Candidatus Pacearchaeota archaeon]|nr:hypothetical protein [Candidatus Pacearchaeota archaeon]